ncbi:MAG: lysozyme inhibitor LprI family protein [Granulosicoccaceae bacterium]
MSLSRTTIAAKCLPALTLLLCLLPALPVYSASNVLQQCVALSTEANDIHNCMDNYLDVMDDNIADITAFIGRELQGKSLEVFQRSQQAFYDYRRQNCLWYLEFSSPRDKAEQIAKNCLANMSQQRLSELQSLIASEKNSQHLQRGFYIYGPNRNSFQACGSDQRLWVEGTAEAVGQLQQDYLQVATTDLQIMHVVLDGQLDLDVTAPQDHAGVVNITKVLELRVPQEADCSLPGGQALAEAPGTAEPTSNTTTEPPAEVAVTPGTNDPIELDDDPEQVLRAYFGDWLAECVQRKSQYRCDLKVAVVGDDGKATAEDGLMFTLTRHKNKRSQVTLEFPYQEIDSPAKIRWQVDQYNFGDIVGSEIRVDESGAKQIISERKFLRDDLLPLLKQGQKLSVEVVEDVNDDKGDKYSVTLLGLTKALRFADGFVSSGSL